MFNNLYKPNYNTDCIGVNYGTNKFPGDDKLSKRSKAVKQGTAESVSQRNKAKNHHNSS